MEPIVIPSVSVDKRVVIERPGPLLSTNEPEVVVIVRVSHLDGQAVSAFMNFDGLNALRSTLDVLHAQAFFATLGEEVASADVPALVLDGRLVFAYGYGSDLAIDEFTTLDGMDLWAWQGGHRDADPDQVERWGPYRVAPTTEDILVTMGTEPGTEGIWIGPGEPDSAAVDAREIARVLDNLPPI